MVWARFDDNWFEREDVLSLTVEQRWHLFCLIEYCCRNERWSGELRTADACRVSDIDDPDAAHAAFTQAGFTEPIHAGIRLLTIAEHIPDDRKRNDRERKRRNRAHAKGDHRYCTPGVNCDEKQKQFDLDSIPISSSLRVPGPVPVPEPVPGVPRTVAGQVTGQSQDKSRDNDGDDDPDTAFTTDPGLAFEDVNLATGEVREPRCIVCGGVLMHSISFATRVCAKRDADHARAREEGIA